VGLVAVGGVGESERPWRRGVVVDEPRHSINGLVYVRQRRRCMELVVGRPGVVPGGEAHVREPNEARGLDALGSFLLAIGRCTGFAQFPADLGDRQRETAEGRAPLPDSAMQAAL
jgi:hypothetical protein